MEAIHRTREVNLMRGMRGGPLWRPRPMAWRRPYYRPPWWGLGSLLWLMAFPLLGAFALFFLLLLRIIVR